jgi:hypothetical protein
VVGKKKIKIEMGFFDFNSYQSSIGTHLIAQGHDRRTANRLPSHRRPVRLTYHLEMVVYQGILLWLSMLGVVFRENLVSWC